MLKRRKHTVEVIDPALQINEELDFHERGWIVQRGGWILMFTFVVAGAVGAFGEGPLSKNQQAAGSVKAEYEKFFRYETEMKISLEADEHISSIALPQDYVQHFRIVRFEPQPENNETRAGEIIFNFLPGDNRKVSIYLVAKDFGPIGGKMKVNDQKEFSLQHFIYP